MADCLPEQLITLSNGHVFTPTTTPPTGQLQFAGFISDDLITSLTLTTTGDSWVVLNLLIGSPAPPTVALSSSANPSIAEQLVTFTATVTPVSGTITPTGSVVFLDGGAQIGTGTLDSTGTATFQAAGLSAGQHTITAQYVGDDNYSSGGLSSTLLQTVGKVTPEVTVTPGASTITAAQVLLVTVVVSGTSKEARHQPNRNGDGDERRLQLCSHPVEWRQRHNQHTGWVSGNGQ